MYRKEYDKKRVHKKRIYEEEEKEYQENLDMSNDLVKELEKYENN